MITAARVAEDGSYVRFADERSGVIPWAELRLPGPLERVVVPRPLVIEIHVVSGGVEEVPWDFARRFADERYRESAEAAAARGRLVLGGRLRALRSERGETQHALARRAGLNAVSIARIKAGDQLPRYRTLVGCRNEPSTYCMCPGELSRTQYAARLNPDSRLAAQRLSHSRQHGTSGQRRASGEEYVTHTVEDTAAGQAIAEAAGRTFIEYRTGARMRYNREELRSDWFLVS